jgi:hypothetical protein
LAAGSQLGVANAAYETLRAVWHAAADARLSAHPDTESAWSLMQLMCRRASGRDHAEGSMAQLPSGQPPCRAIHPTAPALTLTSLTPRSPRLPLIRFVALTRTYLKFV